MEKINQRIKELRKALNMTQMSFSQVISLSSGYLAGIETDKRRVNDRLIKLVCSSFNVNETWLRRGTGEMLLREGDEQFVKMAGLFRELDKRYQDYILKEIALLLKIQEEDKAEKEAQGSAD
ncbi:MAG: helix-turn-helix transcriptional regulator [Treponema sp.]|nr:helix-turn-helix transcriptional regulator [Treponema sp.]